MTSSIDNITHWKAKLNTDCDDAHINALTAIILVINQTEKSEKENVLKVILNRDLCHLFCKLLSCNTLKKTALINKIMCELSECAKFYKSDVFIVIEAYFRILNSFPRSRLGYNDYRTCKKHIDDIFKCISLIIIRSKQQNISFNNDRFLIIQFVGTIKNISNGYLHYHSALMLLNLMIEMTISFIEYQGDTDKEHIEEYLYEIVMNLRIFQENLKDEKYSIILWEIITNMMILSSFGKLKNKLLLKSITDKTLLLMEHSVNENQHSAIYYEVFCNSFYNVLSSNIMDACKKRLLNYFFKINGHHFIINQVLAFSSHNETVSLKFQILLTEIITQFYCLLQNVKDNDDAIFMRYFHMIINSNESNLMINVFTDYIDLKWQPWTKSDKSLCEMEKSIIKFEKEKLFYDSGISNFLLSSFIKCLANASANQKLEVSPSTKIVKKISNSVKLELNFDYFKWWLLDQRNKSRNCQKMLIKFLSSKSPCFDYFNKKDASIFNNHGFLMQAYYNPLTDNILHTNLLKIMPRIKLLNRDVKTLLHCLSSKSSDELLYVLITLKTNAVEVNKNEINSVALSIDKILEKEFKRFDIRLGCLELMNLLLLQHITPSNTEVTRFYGNI